MPDTTGQSRPLADADAESLAEEFIDSATAGGGDVHEEAADEVGADEDGGPFIVLDDEGRLPPEPGEAEEGREPVDQEQQKLRGARWASRHG